MIMANIPAVVVSLLYVIAAVKATGVSLTANVSSGLVCPEGLELTCITINVVPITTLSWFKNAVELDYLQYIFDMSDEYPFVVRDIPSVTGISLGINNATLVGANVDFDATLIANVKVLYNMGFRNISCGSANEMDRFDISELDIEVPSRPSFVSVDLVHNSISSLLEQLTIQYRRSIYTRNSCQYRQNSYFNTSVSLDGNILQTVITDINDSNCNELYCTIRLTNFSASFGDDEDFEILVTAGNIYNESEVATFDTSIYPSIASYFIFSLDIVNCETIAECVLLRPLNITNCTVRYGTDSSYTDLDIRSIPLNQPLTLTELLYDTTYYLEAIFSLSGGVPEVYHIRRNFSTGMDTCRSRNDTVVIAVVIPIIVVLLVISLSLVGIIILYIITTKRRRKSIPLSHDNKEELHSIEIIPDEEHRGKDEEVKEAIERQATEQHIADHVYEDPDPSK